MQKWWVTNGATVEIFHHQSQIVTFHWHEIKVLVEREVWNFEVPYLCLSAFSVKWQQMTALGRAAGIKEKRKHLTPSVDWCPFTGSDLVYVATSSLHVQYWPGWGFFFFVRAHSVTASRSGWTTSPDTGKAKWSPSFFPLLTKPALIKIKSSCQGVGVTINTLSNCYQWHRKISCYVTDFSKQTYLTRNMIEPILKPHVFSLCMQWKHKTTADDDVVHHNI